MRMTPQLRSPLREQPTLVASSSGPAGVHEVGSGRRIARTRSTKPAQLPLAK